MMENETLKQLVLAKCEEVAPIFATKYELAPFVNVQCHFDGNGFGIFRNWTDSDAEFEVCRLRVELPAHSGEWWIAAKILEIETEMSIDEFELSMAIRQHYNDMQDAHHAGFTNGNENGIHMTKEQSWEAFIGDYGKEEMKQPVPFFESQLHELCVALGWQGGTYHQVLAEIKRLKQRQLHKADAILITLKEMAHRLADWDDLDKPVNETRFVNPVFITGLYLLYGTIDDVQVADGMSRIEYLRKVARIIDQRDNRTESHC